MDIESLRCFIAVVETGSYTKAADQVHRSQSAVSQKMQKLAEQTGKPLFVKAGRLLEMTEDAKFLLGYASHILSLHDDVIRQMQGSQQIVRPLQLGCPDDYAETILPKIVASIQAVIPSLPIQVHCNNSTNLELMLAAGTLDTAIVSRSSSKVAGQHLEKSDGVWAFDGDIERLAQTYTQLGCLPLIVFEKSCLFHQAAIQGLSQLNISSQVVCSSNSVGAIRSLVLAGQGITVVAKCSASGMTILSEENNPLAFNLPKLPSVIIEMVVAADAHPNFGRAQLLEVCEGYVTFQED